MPRGAPRPPTVGPAAVATEQLALHGAGDVRRAYALNSRANQDRWCGPERFEAVLRGHPDFAQLLVKDSGVAVASCEANGNVATVHVSLPGRVDHGPSKGASGSAAGGVSMVWTMVVEEQQLAGEADRSDGGGGGLVWRTEKVIRVDETSS